MTGNAAIDAIRRNAERNEAEHETRKNTPLMPFRYFTKIGETKEIIIVDDAPSFVRNEHCMQDRRTKRWDVYLPCIDEHCNCPACSVSARPSYFAMYLTIVDNNLYVNGDGDEVPFSKKLLVVKPMQQKKIMRYYEREGTLRGMILTMTRDGEKDASIGDPEFAGFADEDELQSYVYDYTDKEGVVHEVFCDEPYDYLALFPDMTEQQIAALVGAEPASGSRRNDDRSLGRGRQAPAQDDDQDDAGFGGSGARRVASRRAASAPPEDDVQDDAPPARAARRPAPAAAPAAPARRPAPAPAAPARAARPAARQAAPAQDAIDPDDNPEAGAELPWDGEEGAEPAEPAPRSARPAPRRAAPAVAPEPEQAAPRASMAARRGALRR